MRWVALGACVSVGVSGGFGNGSSADAGRSTLSGDSGATARYLHAQRMYTLTNAENVGQVSTAQDQIVAHVTQTCRGVLRGAPTGGMAKAFAREILGALSLAAQKVRSSSADRFAQEVSSLHWSDPRLATMVASLVSARGRRRRMQLPRLCSDARYWAVRQFASLAPDTLRFNRLFYSSTLVFQASEGHGTLEAAITNRLSKYETARQRGEQHELKPPAELGRSTPTWVALIESLGMGR